MVIRHHDASGFCVLCGHSQRAVYSQASLQRDITPKYVLEYRMDEKEFRGFTNQQSPLLELLSNCMREDKAGMFIA